MSNYYDDFIKLKEKASNTLKDLILREKNHRIAINDDFFILGANGEPCIQYLDVYQYDIWNNDLYDNHAIFAIIDELVNKD